MFFVVNVESIRFRTATVERFLVCVVICSRVIVFQCPISNFTIVRKHDFGPFRTFADKKVSISSSSVSMTNSLSDDSPVSLLRGCFFLIQ